MALSYNINIGSVFSRRDGRFFLHPKKISMPSIAILPDFPGRNTPCTHCLLAQPQRNENIKNDQKTYRGVGVGTGQPHPHFTGSLAAPHQVTDNKRLACRLPFPAPSTSCPPRPQNNGRGGGRRGLLLPPVHLPAPPPFPTHPQTPRRRPQGPDADPEATPPP